MKETMPPRWLDIIGIINCLYVAPKLGAALICNQTTVPQWIGIAALVFGGCGVNFFTLEAVIQ